jgi:hypothetical protein
MIGAVESERDEKDSSPGDVIPKITYQVLYRTAALKCRGGAAFCSR